MTAAPLTPGQPAHDVDVDVVGVGFGPSNIALAIALREHPGPPLRTAFFEAQAEPGWHVGMLLEDASMQVCFLKDLVTFRNPASPFSFVSFLHEKGRLADFTNRGAMEPLRVEFAAYLRWAADAFADEVHYASRVEGVRPVHAEDGGVDAFDVVVASPDGVRTVRARSVVVAAGLQPRVPTGITLGARVWHSRDHLHRVGDLDAPQQLVVVGTGQSAMEIALDLNERHPDAVVHLVSSQFGAAPSYQGPLVNAIFDPESVDLLYDAEPAVRERIDRLHRNTNNGTASTEVVQDFFDRVYRDRWLGRERLVLHRVSRVTSVVEASGAAEVVIRSDADGTETRVAADAVVLGTGYLPLDMSQLLGDEADLVRRDPAGRPLLDRDHQALLTAPGAGRLVLVGQSDHLHGISTTLLSTVAVRAGEIAELLGGPPGSEAPPGAEGTPARIRATAPTFTEGHEHVAV